MRRPESRFLTEEAARDCPLPHPHSRECARSRLLVGRELQPRRNQKDKPQVIPHWNFGRNSMCSNARSLRNCPPNREELLRLLETGNRFQFQHSVYKHARQSSDTRMPTRLSRATTKRTSTLRLWFWFSFPGRLALHLDS